MWYLPLLERNLLPDALIRAGIRQLLARRLSDEAARQQANNGQYRRKLIEELSRSPLAVHTEEANEQHYEVPAAFFQHVLGPRLKYSSALWPGDIASLAEAEEYMLALTTERARIADGQEILELGCGWGSLTLYLAERFPASRLTAVSNSRTQKVFIDAAAERRGLRNVEVISADINELALDRTFDRIVSVEMFEHVRNYKHLFHRIAGWLKRDAFLFVHIFCHARYAYTFETDGDDDWMARYFFTGGIMPSADLFRAFPDDLQIVDEWPVNGRHYEQTCNAWLANMDAHRGEILPILATTYGAVQARRWWVFWRVFFMACAELFGYRDGEEWRVQHYLLKVT